MNLPPINLPFNSKQIEQYSMGNITQDSALKKAIAEEVAKKIENELAKLLSGASSSTASVLDKSSKFYVMPISKKEIDRLPLF